MKTNLLSTKLAIIACTVAVFSSCDRPPETAQAPQAQSSAPGKATTPAVPGFDGNFEALDCQFAVGWVRDTAKPDEPVAVEFYDGTTLIGRATADIFRQDLKDAGKGTGRHGFSFSIPASVKDGAQHSIAAKISGTDSAVYGSPRTLMCPAAEAHP